MPPRSFLSLGFTVAPDLIKSLGLLGREKLLLSPSEGQEIEAAQQARRMVFYLFDSIAQLRHLAHLRILFMLFFPFSHSVLIRLS